MEVALQPTATVVASIIWFSTTSIRPDNVAHVLMAATAPPAGAVTTAQRLL